MKQVTLKIPELSYATEEALNRLRVNMKFCGYHTRKVLVTSSLPDEGKSLIAIHLWRLLAEAGFPTAFVDLDFRKSMICSDYKLGMETGKKSGMEDYLSGLADYGDILYETNIPNGFFVPCFNLIENPATILTDRRLEEALNRLSDACRYVIIDAPPVGIVSDALQIAPICDGAILVIHAGKTKKKQAKETLNLLKRTEVPMLGAVLNRVDINTRHYTAYGEYYGKTK